MTELAARAVRQQQRPLVLSAKTWMPTPAFARGRHYVGMTARGTDDKSGLRATGMSRLHRL
jgi:hypothetical protein